jgi:hypothetical protein
MSKVVSMIKATDTGRRSMKRERLSKVMSIRENVQTDVAFNYNIMYRIEVKFGAQTTVPAHDTDRLQYAIEDTKKNVSEYIFGEFRPYFRELSLALWEEDVPAAQEIMARFEKQMFEQDSFE